LKRGVAFHLLMGIGTAVLAIVTPARASFTYYAVVAVPADNPDVAWQDVIHVTHLWSTTAAIPGYEVSRTCLPGFVTQPVGDSLVHRNVNAANMAGLSVEVDLDRAQDRQNWSVVDSFTVGPRKYVVDTLYVVLHADSVYARVPRDHAAAWARVVAAVGARSPLSDSQREQLRLKALAGQFRFLDQILDTTIICILDNAARSRPPVRIVDLTVVGPDRARAKSGTFPAKRVMLQIER
jgi:hypothetical protein